jgi:hypothetical protein
VNSRRQSLSGSSSNVSDRQSQYSPEQVRNLGREVEKKINEQGQLREISGLEPSSSLPTNTSSREMYDTIKILQLKIKRLEELLALKDNQITELMKQKNQ